MFENVSRNFMFCMNIVQREQESARNKNVERSKHIYASCNIRGHTKVGINKKL